MKSKLIPTFILLAMLFAVQAIGQTCAPVTFKTLYYQNDSNMYPAHTIAAAHLTSDNSYFVGGSQIMKTDLNGNRLWDTANFNAFYQQDAMPYLAPDGSYYVLFSNYKLSKLDASENIIWENNIIDTSCYCNQARHITQTSDGGFIITGSSNIFDTSYYRNRVFVVKTNANGDTTWTKLIGKSILDDKGYYTKETSDGGYLVVGNFQPSAIEYRIGMIKLNSAGQEQWFKTLPHRLPSRNDLYTTQTTDNGIVITTEIDSSVNYSIVLKINENGDELYNHVFFGVDNGAVTELPDGNIVVGINDSLYKLDGATATVIDRKGYVGLKGEKLAINSVELSCDNGYILAANAAVFKGSTICCGSDFKFYDFSSYLLKTTSTLDDVSPMITGIDKQKLETLVVYPNPFSKRTTLQLEAAVYNAQLVLKDVLGKTIYSTIVNGNNIQFTPDNVAPGVYFISLKNNAGIDLVAPTKVIIQ